MKRIESKDVTLRLVSRRGKAIDSSDGSIYFFNEPLFNGMLDLERMCFQHLEEEDTLFKIQDWERKNR